jgi:pimeloyl-ACP methyl ester carboxylesterase
MDWRDILQKYAALIPDLPGPEKPERLLPPAAEEGFAKSFDGTSIYWERHGPNPRTHPSSKPPMLFCYGLVCSVNQWRTILARYSVDRTCVLFDYRGHHKSSSPADPSQITVSALARDAATALDAAGVTSPAHVWGHSLGVNVALELAAGDPERTRSVVVCCGTTQNPFRYMFHTNRLEAPTSAVLKIYPQYSSIMDTLWKLSQLRPEATELLSKYLGFNRAVTDSKDISTYARSVANISPQTFFWLMRDFTKGTTDHLLPKIRVPTLVMAGAHDPITPASQMKQFAAKIPGAEYVEIPGGSHNIQLDFPEYIALRVEEFWRSRKLEPIAKANTSK